MMNSLRETKSVCKVEYFRVQEVKSQVVVIWIKKYFPTELCYPLHRMVEMVENHYWRFWFGFISKKGHQVQL